MPERTPGFLAWSLQHRCELREFDSWDNPIQVERSLRPVRAVRRAQLESRIEGDVCIQPFTGQQSLPISNVMGFRISEVMEFYGGGVARHCDGCPANALQVDDPGSLAGCFGFVPDNGIDPDDWTGKSKPVPVPISELAESVLSERMTAVERLGFTSTVPIWHGLWMVPHFNQERLTLILDLMDSILNIQKDSTGDVPTSWLHFRHAIARALEQELTLRVDVYPAGEVLENRWIVDSHCPMCKVSDHDSLVSPLKKCTVCGYDGTREPRRKRFVRGKRPYWELIRFLGLQKAKELLDRYTRERGLEIQFTEPENDS